ncbi:MAG: DUF1287 domain-containing protein [Syntrophomonas sp.]|nr:DUF1287 domain-containing protein [Syntrophomonas sp.]
MISKRRGLLLLVAMVGLVMYSAYGNILSGLRIPNVLESMYQGSQYEYPQLFSAQDQNQNGIPDSMDIVNGARQEVEKGTVYDGSYFQGGYPPEGRGACTDVIWRAFKNAGYDLKKMMDEDIRCNSPAYGATGRKPDPSIDFRRVSNLQIFFKSHGQELTTEIVPGDVTNLTNWQPGDIVVFGLPLEHIGIISNQRGQDGVPLMIHNCGPKASEDSFYLLNWPSKITHHFRFISLKQDG